MPRAPMGRGGPSSLRDRVRRLAESLTGRLSTDTRGLARDSALTGTAMVIEVIGLLVRTAAITHLLGLRSFGVFALVVSVCVLVQGFFDVRVELATISFGAKAREGEPGDMAAVIRFSYLVDGLTGVVGFGAIALLAGLTGGGLIGGGDPTLLILYGLTLLFSTVRGTSSALLRLYRRFDSLVWFAIGSEGARIILVLTTALLTRSLVAIIVALVALEAVSGIALAMLSANAFRRESGVPLRSALRDRRPAPRRPMLRMILHTNAIAYGRVAQAQVPAIIIGGILGPGATALYKLGTAAGFTIGKLSGPAQTAILPRLAADLAQHRTRQVRQLLRQCTLIALPVMAVALGVVVLLRRPLLVALGGAELTRAEPILVLTAIASALGGTLFWAAPFLIAVGRSRTMAYLTMISAALQLTAVAILARPLGAVAGGLAILMADALALAWMLRISVRELRRLGEATGRPSMEAGLLLGDGTLGEPDVIDR